VKGTLRQSLAYAIALFGIGVLYRATFISQGFNATDEGWLESLGARIVAGQLPYRDFNYGLPPVSIYQEAALIRVFGDSYGILASRWVFTLEVSLASVLAFTILVRYVRPTLAFLAVLPTCFFSVILFYYSNYSYDGEMLAMLSVALLVHAKPGLRALAVLGGVAGGLAFMSKPTFLGLLPIVLIALLANKLAARREGEQPQRASAGWATAGLYSLGFTLCCLAVLGYFGVQGAAGDLVYKALILPRQSYQIPLGFVIWQDLPQVMFFWPNIAGYLAALLVLLVVARIQGIPEVLRAGVAAVLVAVLVVRALPSSTVGLPTPRQETLLLVILGLLLILNASALLAAVLARGELKAALFPPELPAVALGLQYVAQFNAAGVRYSYYGAFLSVPVALLFLHAFSVAKPYLRRGRLGAGVATWAPLMIGAAIAVTGIVVTHGLVFRDGPRSELSASFTTARLHGISSLPANTSRVDGLVAAVDSMTAPGDPILVLPDFPALYFLTGRRNPTRIGWYETPQVTVSEADQAVADMKRDPPKLVILETYDEGDFLRSGPKLDYAGLPQLLPVYSYVIANYRLVDIVGDLAIYEPLSAPASAAS
jgi:hypothetical protein